MRVFIANSGVIASIGLNKKQFTENMIAGKSGIKKMTNNHYSDLCKDIGGEISNKELSEIILKIDPEDTIEDRSALFAVISAEEAYNENSSYLSDVSPDRKGVIVGTSYVGIDIIDQMSATYISKEYRKLKPGAFFKAMRHFPASIIASKYKFEGISYTFDTACSGSLHAAGMGYQLIHSGQQDIMLICGTDSPLIPPSMLAWSKLRMLSSTQDPEKACKPFSKDRNGTVLGEGGGTMILVSEKIIDKYGIKPQAEFLGYGYANDTTHVSNPNKSYMIKSMNMAIKNSGLNYNDIDYIQAHGTATYANDLAETNAIKELFKENAYKIKINSIKSMCGHLIGASGAISAIAVISQMNKNVIHPTLNLNEKDPECDLDYVPIICQNYNIENALINSFAVGGSFATVILKKV